jgi:hypothetical protein
MGKLIKMSLLGKRVTEATNHSQYTALYLGRQTKRDARLTFQQGSDIIFWDPPLKPTAFFLFHREGMLSLSNAPVRSVRHGERLR